MHCWHSLLPVISLEKWVVLVWLCYHVCQTESGLVGGRTEASPAVCLWFSLIPKVKHTMSAHCFLFQVVGGGDDSLDQDSDCIVLQCHVLLCCLVGTPTLPARRLQWSYEGIASGSELGHGSCDFRTLHLCPPSHHATLLPALASHTLPTSLLR